MVKPLVPLLFFDPFMAGLSASLWRTIKLITVPGRPYANPAWAEIIQVST
jgi:hypothetical protein